MHLIQKQLVEVTMNGTESQAVTLQREITALCENELLQVIEKVLEPYNNYGDDIIIEYLRISVDNLHTGNLKQVLTDAVAQQLKAAIEKRVQQQNIAVPAPSSDVELLGYRREAQSADHRNVELVFFHFLLTGVRLWWALPDRTKNWENALLNIFSDSPPLTQQLLQLLHGSANARERFSLQFSLPWQREMLFRLSPAVYVQTLSVQEILQQVIPSFTTAQARPFIRWQADMISEHANAPLSLPAITASAWTRFVKAGKQEYPALIKKHVPPHIQETLLSCLEQKAGIPTGEKTDRPALTTTVTTEEVRDGYYIHNAGLVLLTPFITHFLKYCGAADDGGIIQAGYSVALLEFLATGRTDVGEEELLFNKILCGIPPEQPVERITAIDPAHVAEADNLLNMVISNWPLLKNTSPDGLRASFLHRAGKLSVKENDDNWLLQVERESYDEWLLCDIPWGYNMVVLPYTKNKMIWVEWT